MADNVEAINTCPHCGYDMAADYDYVNKVKVMVGGAPVTQAFADRAGADGFAPDAAMAVDKARELLGGTR